MAEKPTYEDLKKRVQELEQEESKRKQSENALKESENNLKRAQRLANIGSWYYNWSSQTEIWSDECFKLYGINKDNYPGNVVPESLSFKIYENPEETDELSALLAKEHDTYELEFTTVPINGQTKTIHSYCEVEKDNDGNILKVFGADHDISQLKEAEEKIRLLAFYDGLTGLANRMLFMDRLDLVIKESTRKKKHFALLFLDLDNFKRINDTLGHHIGDLLLKKVADNIIKSIRNSDSITRISEQTGREDSVIARLGGDEFTILATDLNAPESAALVARRLLREIPKVYNLDGHDVSITTSIGISVFPEDGNKADALLKNADTAMYHAKNEGKNTYQFFTDSMNQAVLERFSIGKDLRRALQRNELILYYQPQIDLSNRRIVGAEALIRWHHPHRGMIPPDKFIPIAEETDIIIDINKWVLCEACRQAKQWIQEGSHPITVAVNLSGYKLDSQNIIQSLESILDQTQLDPKNIEIEITENILIQDTDETVSTLNKIKDLNLKIAMDDFGTGYSSLSYLTKFPVDTIKIDRSFIMGCTAESNNLVIIKAIIAMGHSLGKKIVAEGVETKEHYHLLKELGCDEAQGYFFNRPVPPDEFIRLLANGTI